MHFLNLVTSRRITGITGIGNFHILNCKPTWYTPRLYGYKINLDIVVIEERSKENNNCGSNNSMTTAFCQGKPLHVQIGDH
jgi:hypothetical protein